MKTNARFLLLIGASLAIELLPALSAQAQLDRLYLQGDAGATLMQDTRLKSFFGPVAPGTMVEFDPGPRFGVLAGYQLTDWFAAEAETGVMDNNISAVGGSRDVDASLANIPFLLNARFRMPTQQRFSPFFGGGLGMSASVIDANHFDYGGIHMSGTQSDVVFAYQFFAGVRYALNPHMGLSLEYHYFATTAPEWKADFHFAHTSDTMSFGGAQTHIISVAFDYQF